MTIYLYNEANELLRTYKNVLSWDSTYVFYLNNRCKAKEYVELPEYFSDKER